MIFLIFNNNIKILNIEMLKYVWQKIQFNSIDIILYSNFENYILKNM